MNNDTGTKANKTRRAALAFNWSKTLKSLTNAPALDRLEGDRRLQMQYPIVKIQGQSPVRTRRKQNYG